MAELVLRDYQVDIVDGVRSHFKQGRKSVFVQLSTGGGKTVIASKMLKTCSQKGMRAFFMCHRRELIKQTILTLDKFGVGCGVISAGFPEYYHHKVQVCSVSTMFRRLHKVTAPDLIFWDEARHIGARTWTQIYQAFPNAYHVMLDATPTRLDGKPLSEYASAMVTGPSMSWLIENGFLADYKMYAPSTVDVSGLRTQMGDYSKSQLDELMNKPTITGNAVNEYIKYCPNKRAVVFAVSVKHSLHIRDSFLAKGIPAEHIDGKTNTAERDQAIENFRSGKTKILTNVDIASCGLDIPAMEAVILLRPTQSVALYLQQIGRVLRPGPGKTAIILDHVGNVSRHGLPDEARNWHLDGKKGRLAGEKSDENTSVKICDLCFAAQPPGADKCKYCEHTFEKKPREIAEVDGELEEIDPKAIRRSRLREQASADSLEDLYQIGVQRNYKHPRRWASHIFKARQAKKNRGLG